MTERDGPLAERTDAVVGWRDFLKFLGQRKIRFALERVA